MPRRWRIYPNAVWCDFHGTHHERTGNPYDMCNDAGRPYDECGPDVWRNLAILATPEEEF